MMTMTRMMKRMLSRVYEREGPRGTVKPADRRAVLTGLAALPVVAACSPTVRIEAPTEPIEINLNVRIRIDRELDELFEEKDDIF